MGSLDRKTNRNALRVEYKKLTEEWNRMKRNGEKVRGQELGKKPSFGQFVKKMKLAQTIHEAQMKAAQAQREIDEKNSDLAWEEEDA